MEQRKALFSSYSYSARYWYMGPPLRIKDVYVCRSAFRCVFVRVCTCASACVWACVHGYQFRARVCIFTMCCLECLFLSNRWKNVWKYYKTKLIKLLYIPTDVSCYELMDVKNILYCPLLGSISSMLFCAAFTSADLKSAIKIEGLTVFFALLGSAHIKAVLKILVKSTLGVKYLCIGERERWIYFICILRKKKTNQTLFMIRGLFSECSERKLHSRREDKKAEQQNKDQFLFNFE